MTNGIDLSQHVAGLETELRHLRAQAQADLNTIAHTKEQLDRQQEELDTLVTYYESELRIARRERDTATRIEQEITGILRTAAAGIVSGLHKLEKLPASPVSNTPAHAPNTAQRVTAIGDSGANRLSKQTNNSNNISTTTTNNSPAQDRLRAIANAVSDEQEDQQQLRGILHRIQPLTTTTTTTNNQHDYDPENTITQQTPLEPGEARRRLLRGELSNN